jgi:hypothetical protein
MDITTNMYRLAKKIVEAYENKGVVTYQRNNIQDPAVAEAYSKMKELEETKGLYLNPGVDGIIMPCCGQRYVFSYDAVKHLEKNEHLEYRADGTIDLDDKSPQPTFVAYNACREAIRQAKVKGLGHVHWRVSVAVAEAIKKEGYIDHNDALDTISWR